MRVSQGRWGHRVYTDAGGLWTLLFFHRGSQEGKISSQALLLEQMIISAVTAWAPKE